jgi:hypothetical protein
VDCFSRKIVEMKAVLGFKKDKDASSKSQELSDYADPKKYLTAGSKLVVSNRLSNSTAITPAKLERIMKQRQPYRMKSNEEIFHEKIDNLFEERRKTMLSSRLRNLPMKPATQFAAIGDEYCLRKEIELGHDINSRDSYNGRTILHEAAAAGHFHIVRFLCNEFGSELNIDHPTKLGGSTALHLAVERGYRQVSSHLITCGANIHLQDKQGNTPLHLVKTLPLLKLLLKYPVNSIVRNAKGETPLGYFLNNTANSEEVQGNKEQVREMIDWLKKREESQFLENARQEAMKDDERMKRAARREGLVRSEESTTAVEVLSDDSSPMTSPRGSGGGEGKRKTMKIPKKKRIQNDKWG